MNILPIVLASIVLVSIFFILKILFLIKKYKRKSNSTSHTLRRRTTAGSNRNIAKPGYKRSFNSTSRILRRRTTTGSNKNILKPGYKRSFNSTSFILRRRSTTGSNKDMVIPECKRPDKSTSLIMQRTAATGSNRNIAESVPDNNSNKTILIPISEALTLYKHILLKLSIVEYQLLKLEQLLSARGPPAHTNIGSEPMSDSQ